MASVFPRGKKLWMKVKEAGLWIQKPTPYPVGDEHNARRFAKRAQQLDEHELAPKQLTHRSYFRLWLKTRKDSDVDWNHDEARMRMYVLPVIGDMLVTEVRTKHILDVVARPRRKVAPKTVYNVYSVMCALFREARIAGLIEQTPCILDERHLGPKVDKDPEWRNTACSPVTK